MRPSLLFSRQNIMRRVILSLMPIFLFSIYAFGWRMAAILAVVTVAGVATEYLTLRFVYGNSSFKIPEAIFVSCLLYTLILPPTIPFLAAALGIAFGILFGKGVFGGFGKNVFNPALLGRCFVFLAFPTYMTMNWIRPFSGLFGGFLRFSGGVDAITHATPLGTALVRADFLRLLFGPLPGTPGEISAFLILLAAVYLVLSKTASWEIMLASTASFLGLSILYYLLGATTVSPVMSLLSGGILFAIVFMATDPITAPAQKTAKVLYGVLIGGLAITIRTFSNFPEGAMFAVLLGNSFAPLLDLKVKEFMAQRRAEA